jgi:hypothetical protein
MVRRNENHKEYSPELAESKWPGELGVYHRWGCIIEVKHPTYHWQELKMRDLKKGILQEAVSSPHVSRRYWLRHGRCPVLPW